MHFALPPWCDGSSLIVLFGNYVTPFEELRNSVESKFGSPRRGAATDDPESEFLQSCCAVPHYALALSARSRREGSRGKPMMLAAGLLRICPVRPTLAEPPCAIKVGVGVVRD